MARRIVCVLVLALTGCAGVSDLTAPATPALGDRSGAVRAKADAAVKEGKYADAWNLEAQAGSDRGRLEAIALASLEADRGPYEDMLKALRTKFGGLTPAGRARVEALVRAKE
jgi:hypothetical protein